MIIPRKARLAIARTVRLIIPRRTRLAVIRRTLLIVAGAALVAVLMSTQLLLQPFVWRNWDFGDIMDAWLDLLSDRLVVAMTIAAMLATLGQMSGVRPALLRTVLAVCAGAGLGEWILLGYGSQDDPQDLASVVGP